MGTIYLIKSWSNWRSKSAVFGKTIRARNIKFWVKVDQICVNKIIKAAFEIFYFFPPKKNSKSPFLIFFLNKKVANFKGLQKLKKEPFRPKIKKNEELIHSYTS